MEKTITVALWVGNVESENELLDYVDISYSEDGADISSDFLKEFNIDQDDFDEDFFECAFRDRDSNMISILLEGCSFEDMVIPSFQKKYGEKMNSKYNAIILMYDYNYSLRSDLSTIQKRKFVFVGNISATVNI